MSTAPTPENPGLLNWLLILFLGVIWGSAFMSISIALEGFGPNTVTAVRLGIGAATLTLLGAILGQPLSAIGARGAKRGWIFVFFIGSISWAIPLLLLTWGQLHVPSAFAGVSMATVPLLLIPLVFLFSPDEGIGPRRVIGMVIGFIGLYLLVGNGAFAAQDNPNATLGKIACIGAACCYAIGSILMRRAPKMPPLSLAAGTLCIAALIAIPYALLTEGVPQAVPHMPALSLLYAALFPTAVGTLVRVRVITTAGSLFMSITSYMVPLWAIFFGMAILDEALPPQLYLALAIILTGIFISQSRAIFAAFKRA